MKEQGELRRARARALDEPRLRSRTTEGRKGSRIRLVLAAGFALAAALAVAVPLAGAAKDETILVSRASDGVPGDRGSAISSVSADGRYVAFESFATNLSDADADALSDIFVRDTLYNRTMLVSRQSDPGQEPVNGHSFDPEISDDGRFVVFESDATNLSAADTDSLMDVFVHDLVTGKTTLVSRQSATDGGAKGNDLSEDPTVSANGRYVAFASAASNLNADADPSAFANVYVRDLIAETTELVSRANGPDGEGANIYSETPSISADGNHVAFSSGANNLTSVALTAGDNVFVRNLERDKTILVSRQSESDGGAPADGGSIFPSISGDGGRIAFVSNAANLSAADGSAFDVFMHDLEAGTTRLVSRQSGSDGEGAVDNTCLDFCVIEPSISSNGRYVAFESQASNLSPDSSGDRHVYVRDLATETLLLVSRSSGPENEPADLGAIDASISATGRFVTFTSSAANLDESVASRAEHVYLRDILGAPAHGGLLAGAAQFGPSLGVQRIEAHSDANAENARGHFGISQPPDDELFASVTCLVVSGNRAVAGGVIESDGLDRPRGSGFLLFVEDNGSPGRGDRAETVWSDAPPTSCPTPREPADELERGNFVVKQAEG